LCFLVFRLGCQFPASSMGLCRYWSFFCSVSSTWFLGRHSLPLFLPDLDRFLGIRSSLPTLVLLGVRGCGSLQVVFAFGVLLLAVASSWFHGASTLAVGFGLASGVYFWVLRGVTAGYRYVIGFVSAFVFVLWTKLPHSRSLLRLRLLSPLWVWLDCLLACGVVDVVIALGLVSLFVVFEG